MRYTIDILRSAQKGLAQVAHREQKRIVEAIYSLAENPHPLGCKKLSGRSAWRIRVGTYRVIYEIHDDRLVILVVAVAHRKEIYR